jgi:hypothetical protein
MLQIVLSISILLFPYILVFLFKTSFLVRFEHGLFVVVLVHRLFGFFGLSLASLDLLTGSSVLILVIGIFFSFTGECVGLWVRC